MYGRKWKIWRYTVYALIGVGVLHVFGQKPGAILFPLLLVGIIYFLYKHPPRWLMRFTHPTRPYPSGKPLPRSGKRSAKERPRLRVIEGKKRKIPGGKQPTPAPVKGKASELNPPP